MGLVIEDQDHRKVQLQGQNRTLTAHLNRYRSIAGGTQEALLIGKHRKRHSFESEYRFSSCNNLSSSDNKLDEWQCLPFLMGVNRLTNLEHEYHNVFLVHRMLAFCLQLQWSDTRQVKDSGASGHIASSFDPYLQHYGQNRREWHSFCMDLLLKRNSKDDNLDHLK